MSIGAIDTSRIEAMVAQLKAAAARTSPANINPINDSALQTGKTTGVGDFHSVLKTSLGQVNQVQRQPEQLAQRFEMGDSTISLSHAMISMQKSSIALQQTVQPADHLPIEARQDALRRGWLERGRFRR